MTKYSVQLRTVATATVYVEADDEGAAADIALGFGPDVCAHCSGWNQPWSMEIGEWDVAEDETVGDHTYKAVEEVDETPYGVANRG